MMRPTYTLADIFETPSRAPVLHVLALSTTPLSARAVGRAAGISHTAASATLRDLQAMGLATASRIGRANAYEIVRENAYVRHLVLPAIDAESTIVAELRADLIRTFASHADSLILYGSYATGEQDERSDIDLFALAADERRKQQLEECAREHLGRIQSTYGSPLSLLAYTRAEARARLLHGENPFRAELESTGVILHGLGLGEWGIDGPNDTNTSGAAKPGAGAARKGG